MEKLFLLTAIVATLAMSSCSNDQGVGDAGTDSNGKEISFRTFIDKGTGTRATITDGNNILGFTVTGWWDRTSNGSGDITDPAEGEYLFNAVDITRREAGVATNDWDYEPKLYWPSTGSGVSFYAYSPASSRGVITSNSIENGLYNYQKKPFRYTVPDPGEKEGQEDFLLARTGVKNGGVVGLNFVHALSRVTFSAKKTNPGITYLIKSVELMNIKKSGTVDLEQIPVDGDLSTSYTSTGQTLVLWNTASATAENIAVDLGNSPVSVRDDAYHSILGKTGALMVMPQTTTYATSPNGSATEFMVKVAYKAFVDPDDEASYYAGSKGNADNTYKIVYFPVKDAARTLATGSTVAHTFEMGRQYNFTLTFGADAGGPISFNVNVGAWDDAPVIELPQIVDYYGAGLISETLAKIANPTDYNTPGKGVSLGDILSQTKIFVKDVPLADAAGVFKGLEYFANLQTIAINNSKGLVIDLSACPTVNEIKIGLGVGFAEMDISARTTSTPLQLNVHIREITNAAGATSGSETANLLTIDKLIVWDQFKKAVTGDKIFELNGHSSGGPQTATTALTLIKAKTGTSTISAFPATQSAIFN